MKLRETCCLAILVSVLLFTDISQAITLRYEYTQGQTDNYSLVIVQDNFKSQLSVSRVVENVALGAGQNGYDLYTIKTVFNNGTVWINDREGTYTGPTGDVQRSVIDQQGNVQQVTFLNDANDFVTATDSSLTAQVDFMQRLAVPDFPTGDVAVGASWTRTAHLGDESVTYTYTLEADDDTTGVPGRTCARISVSANFNGSIEQEIVNARRTLFVDGEIIIGGTVYFDVNDKKIVKVTQTIQSCLLTILVGFDGVTRIQPCEQTTTMDLDIQ